MILSVPAQCGRCSMPMANTASSRRIHPPFGMNLFVVQAARRSLSLGTVALGVLPFLIADFVRLALLVAFPAPDSSRPIRTRLVGDHRVLEHAQAGDFHFDDVAWFHVNHARVLDGPELVLDAAFGVAGALGQGARRAGHDHVTGAQAVAGREVGNDLLNTEQHAVIIQGPKLPDASKFFPTPNCRL